MVIRKRMQPSTPSCVPQKLTLQPVGSFYSSGLYELSFTGRKMDSGHWVLCIVFSVLVFLLYYFEIFIIFGISKIIGKEERGGGLVLAA